MTDKVSTHSAGVSDFFTGRSIFITGATGFLGKALIEKLLRSCPGVQEIFLLMRPKKGMSIDERLKKMLKSEIFDEVRKRNPALTDKLIPVYGDIAEDGLGLRPAERQVLIERVSIVYHAAANVKFDDNLKHAVFVNIRSTRDICVLAASMKNIVAFIHVSTMYTQTDKPIVEEKYYDPNINWKSVIKIAETVDENLLDSIMLKYIHPMPNTYTFTKRVAEKIVHDYSKDVPSILFRPSIVISALKEPLDGWVDNLNGPVGIMVGSGKGVLRTLYLEPDIAADYIPVDLAIKLILLSTYKRGVQTITQDPSLYIYNCASAGIRKMTYRDTKLLTLHLHHDIPLSRPIWYPAVIQTNCYMYYYILVIIMHVIPSLIIDQMIKLSGRRPILLKLHRKIYTANKTLSTYLTNSWIFKNDKSMELVYNIKDADEEDFNFELHLFRINEYFKSSVFRTKQFILHEDVTKIEDDKKYMQKLYWLRVAKNIWLIVLFAWFLLRFETFPYYTAIIGGVCLIPFLQN